jgi:transposase InsO family protein
MPWKARKPVDLRMEFVARLRRGERITDLCREFGISRKTGHKLKKRFDVQGVEGLLDRSRAPKVIPHRTRPELVELMLAERRVHPSWGPRKIKHVLEVRLGHALPAVSTIGDALVRAGLVERRKGRSRYKAQGTPHLRAAEAPNEVWCVDYKGQFRLGDRSYCYPLTTTDLYSRFLLGCDAMACISDEQARESFDYLFRERGLPLVIRSDNGVPFASTGLAGLTKLSAYWMRLGIVLNRSRPAHPQDNGQHERMHRTLKRETTRPPRSNLLLQQECFDDFMVEFNEVRPHEGLEMRRPADVYLPSSRPYPDTLREVLYPLHDDVVEVDAKGNIRVGRLGRPYLGSALSGQPVGIREEDDGRWLVSFMDLDLGHVTAHNTFLALGPNPPGA